MREQTRLTSTEAGWRSLKSGANRIPSPTWACLSAPIKSHAIGKGNATKQAMIDAARARGFSPADDNEADAIAILLWALETRGGVQ